jgi:peptidoglycan hydrolase CwlO-like protein
MNQDQVKEKLQKIYKPTTDYVVVFSGKKCKKVNGLYKPFTQEIILHNKNFDNEMLLMFTAIHELSHHILMTEKGKKSPRAHSQEFWATFHDLLDVAEEKGIYQAKVDKETKKLVDEARDISKQIADLQRELGRILFAIDESCQKNGLRYEDIVEREAQIGRQSAKIAASAFQMGDQDVGADIQAEAAKQRDGEKRAAIIAAGQEGKSVIQAKKSTSPAKPVNSEDETVELSREKKRIEKTIESLTRRLEEIKEQLVTRGELAEDEA